MNEYKPGDMVPQSSPLYRVVHDPPKGIEELETFTAMNNFRPVQNAERGFVMCLLDSEGNTETDSTAPTAS